MYETMLKGGYTMIPLLLCSLLSIAVIIEKAFSLRSKLNLPPKLRAHPGDRELRKTYPSPLAEVLNGLDRNFSLGWERNYEALGLILKQSACLFERGLVVLEVVAVVSPLLGLLGTVLGMVEVFGVISQQGVGQAQALSGGIAQALITTIAGLIVAIPALVAYSIYTSKVDHLQLGLEEAAESYLSQIYLDQEIK